MTLMAATVSAAEAKMRFGAYLREAERGQPVVITRHQKPVAALVPAEDVQQLARLRAAGPQAGLAGVAGGWKGSEAVVRRVARLHRTPPRRWR